MILQSTQKNQFNHKPGKSSLKGSSLSLKGKNQLAFAVVSSSTREAFGKIKMILKKALLNTMKCLLHLLQDAE